MDIESIGSRYDVVVAGARAAGASTAMLLARAGLDVLVVDPMRRGSDTLSTHALMRGAVLQLHRWGLLEALRDADTPRIEATTFHYGDDATTVLIKPRDGVDGLYAPRRTVLDRVLVDAAIGSGARVAFGVSLSELVRDGSGRVVGAEIRSADGRSRTVRTDVVIGADGLRSRVARLVGARVTREIRSSTASIYGYVPGLPRHAFEWHYGPALGMGTIPTNHGDACVFASTAPSRFHAERAEGLEPLFRSIVEALSPELWAHIEALPEPPRLRGFAGAPTMLREAWGPGWALVGDAGYFKDPLTAHGITDALRDAELLAGAVLAGTDEALAAYEATRDALSRDVMEVTAEIASLRWTLAELKELHLELSRAMSDEVQAMVERARPAIV